MSIDRITIGRDYYCATDNISPVDRLGTQAFVDVDGSVMDTAWDLPAPLVVVQRENYSTAMSRRADDRVASVLFIFLIGVQCA